MLPPLPSVGLWRLCSRLVLGSVQSARQCVISCKRRGHSTQLWKWLGLCRLLLACYRLGRDVHVCQNRSAHRMPCCLHWPRLQTCSENCQAAAVLPCHNRQQGDSVPTPVLAPMQAAQSHARNKLARHPVFTELALFGLHVRPQPSAIIRFAWQLAGGAPLLCTSGTLSSLLLGRAACR